MSLTKESFLGANEKPHEVEVPEWGISVFLRVMSGTERWAWLQIINKNEDDGRTNMLSLLVRCLCDQSGTRLFGDSEQDITALGGKSAQVLDRLAGEALRVNGIGAEAREDLKKNSPTGESSSSSN